MDCTRDIGMIIMFIIIIYLVINQKNKNKENFALTSDDLTVVRNEINAINLTTVRNEINRIYDMDVEAIRNLGAISKSLLTGTNTFTASTTGTPGQLTIPADNTIMQKDLLVKGGLTVNTGLTVNGPINFTNKDTLLMDILPSGMIIAYKNNTPPPGWTLCNGTNGAPDLRGRFILGAGQGGGLTNRTINSIGGDESVTLTKAQMPKHNHGFWETSYATGGGDKVPHSGQDTYYRPNEPQTTMFDDGGNQSHNNMPPFYVLVYIMKL